MAASALHSMLQILSSMLTVLSKAQDLAKALGHVVSSGASDSVVSAHFDALTDLHDVLTDHMAKLNDHFADSDDEEESESISAPPGPTPPVSPVNMNSECKSQWEPSHPKE